MIFFHWIEKHVIPSKTLLAAADNALISQQESLHVNHNIEEQQYLDYHDKLSHHDAVLQSTQPLDEMEDKATQVHECQIPQDSFVFIVVGVGFVQSYPHVCIELESAHNQETQVDHRVLSDHFKRNQKVFLN